MRDKKFNQKDKDFLIKLFVEEELDEPLIESKIYIFPHGNISKPKAIKDPFNFEDEIWFMDQVIKIPKRYRKVFRMITYKLVTKKTKIDLDGRKFVLTSGQCCFSCRGLASELNLKYKKDKHSTGRVRHAVEYFIRKGLFTKEIVQCRTVISLSQRMMRFI